MILCYLMDELHLLLKTLDDIILEENILKRTDKIKKCLVYLKIHLEEDQKFTQTSLQYQNRVIKTLDKLI